MTKHDDGDVNESNSLLCSGICDTSSQLTFTVTNEPFTVEKNDSVSLNIIHKVKRLVSARAKI